MSNNNTASNASKKGGVSTCTVLLIVFIVLKLTGLIDWPWIWVLSPIWIPIALLFVVFAIVLLLAALCK